MAETKKMKRTALVFFWATSLVLLWFVIKTTRGFVLNTAGWHPAVVATVLLGLLVITATLVIALTLLFSIRKDETPFNTRNVKRLKVIAVLLMVLEPYQYAAATVTNHLYPIVIDGIKVSAHTSWGGCILVSGFVVFCVALIFEYGVSLQKQIDETL